MFTLTPHVIDEAALSRELSDEAAGALVSFAGWVRNHNQGQAVTGLEYQVYPELAMKEGARILEEARARFHVKGVRCVHRHGFLAVGAAAVWVGATAAHRDDAFRAARYVIDELKHRLPIWKKEHYVEATPAWVFCRDHATHVHFEARDYYRKQEKVLSPAALREKRVLVVGAGGLGCPVLTHLVTAGVGMVELVDHDRVDISNLHRQPLYNTSDVGEKKATVAEKKLRQLNPFVKVSARAERFAPANASALVAGRDLVLDCTDSLATKFLLHDACYAAGVPLLSASIYRSEGQLRTFVPGGAHGCLRCLYPEAPDDAAIGNCNDFGVLGAAVGSLGALQAHEALRFLSAGASASVAETIYLDVNALTFLKVKNIKRTDCPVCHAGTRPCAATPDELEIEAADLSPAHLLVDIREESDEALERYRDATAPVVVYCHRGVRSRRLVREYRARGFAQLYSLAGGAASL